MSRAKEQKERERRTSTTRSAWWGGKLELPTRVAMVRLLGGR